MSAHDVVELLPFYANGTLSPADRARVEAELSTCASCARELRELETLATALRARAQSVPAASGRALDAALERIASSPSVITTLRTAWWGAPARYATAAVLVVGIGAAAAAAYHARETEVARDTQGTAVLVDRAGQTLYRFPDTAKRTVNASRPPAAAPPKTVALEAPAAEGAAAQHRLAKSARLELLVRDVESSLRSAEATVRASGGDVTSLADATPRSADVVHGATLDAEVPAAKLDATLDRLASLGAVQNRSVDAQDIGDAIVDEDARLQNLRREERDLRTLMDKGGKVGDILAVQQQLSDVRGRIEELDAKQHHDVHRVATSTIELALAEDRPNAAPAKPGPTARIDGAWHDGVAALADALTNLLATIAWCVAVAPLPLAASAASYAGFRLVKRRLKPA